MAKPASPPVQPRRWRIWLRRVLVALLLLPFVAELGVRAAGVQARLPTFCDWNPRLGCVTKPHLDEHLELLGEHLAFTTNAHGLRNAEVKAKQPGWRRVLVLGDSVTFAPQVPDGKPFANLLDQRLLQNHVDVVNGGSVYLRATDQQLSWFLDVGAALEPDLVVLEFTERNDFADNQHEYWWHPSANGLVRQTDVQPPAHHPWVLKTSAWPIVPWLDDHSQLFGLFRVGYWNIMHLPRVDTGKRWREATAELIARLKKEVEVRGARLAVVVHPSPEFLAGSRGEQELRKDNDHARILAILAEQQLPYTDLAPLLLPDSARPWLNDGHLNVQGHAAVAAFLAPQILTWLGP